MKTPFLGGAYEARSKNLADQRCINLFPEMVDTKEGKDVGAFFMCPGLDLKVTCGSAVIRGMHVVNDSGTETLYVVSGNEVYSVTDKYVATNLGTISTTSGNVSMIDNGTQVALFDSTNGYLITVSTGVLTTLSLPFSAPVTAGYQDGFGIVNQLNSNSWYQSDLNDLSTWSALNFATSAAKPDQVVALADIHREIWVLKEDDFEIWINAGTSGFVFQRVDGVFPEIGCAATFSAAKAGEYLIWLSRNDQGQGIVVLAQGYNPRRISTHAIEYAISQYSTISDAIGYVYQQEGHVFYVLTFPTGNATWVYDLSSGRWHQRAAFSNGVFGRHWGNAFAFFNGDRLVGDYSNGKIYAFNMDTQTDDGTQRIWLRSWRALKQPVRQPVAFSSLSIDMQTGMGVPNGDAPLVMLRWSDDGGHTWSNQRTAAAGPTGATSQRVRFTRLGSTKRNAGLDRIFELSSSDAFNVALIGAYINE